MLLWYSRFTIAYREVQKNSKKGKSTVDKGKGKAKESDLPKDPADGSISALGEGGDAQDGDVMEEDVDADEEVDQLDEEDYDMHDEGNEEVPEIKDAEPANQTVGGEPTTTTG